MNEWSFSVIEKFGQPSNQTLVTFGILLDDCATTFPRESIAAHRTAMSCWSELATWLNQSNNYFYFHVMKSKSCQKIACMSITVSRKLREELRKLSHLPIRPNAFIVPHIISLLSDGFNGWVRPADISDVRHSLQRCCVCVCVGGVDCNLNHMGSKGVSKSLDVCQVWKLNANNTWRLASGGVGGMERQAKLNASMPARRIYPQKILSRQNCIVAIKEQTVPHCTILGMTGGQQFLTKAIPYFHIRLRKSSNRCVFFNWNFQLQKHGSKLYIWKLGMTFQSCADNVWMFNGWDVVLIVPKDKFNRRSIQRWMSTHKTR